MSRFAATTDVAPEKSRMEIERTLQRYGATGFFYAAESGRAIVGFAAHGRTVKMELPLPRRDSDEVVKDPRSSWRERSKDAQERVYDQLLRTKWRCLALAIKAKLEVVESGISTFESEFLAHILTADGSTVGQRIAPQLDAEYRSGKPMPLLLGPTQ